MPDAITTAISGLTQRVAAYRAAISEEHQMPTIGEQLKEAKAKMAQTRTQAAVALTESNDASEAVLVEIGKVQKAAADLLAEIAEVTNGAPPLDDPPAHPAETGTPLPPLTMDTGTPLPTGPYPTYP